MENNRLNEQTIGNAKVIIDILPKGKCIPDKKMTPTSITIHNTGNIGASARNNHNYQKNCNKNGSRIASWHFTVDDKEIYQAQSTNFVCYHAGCSSGNNSSIGIEICMFNDKERQKKCYENAIALVKTLMKYHGFNIDKVKQHYDWTKKDCPQWLRSGKFGYTWNWFKNEITKTEEKKEQATNNNVFYRVVAGSYSDRANANKEIGKLKKDGINAFLLAFVKDGKTYFRVIAGSYNDRSNADEQVEKLKAKGYNAFIAVYNK